MNSLFYVGGADQMDDAHTRSHSDLLARKPSMTLHKEDHGPPQSSSGGPPTSSNPHRARDSLASSSSTTSTLSHPSPKPSMAPSHTRSMSHADVVKQGKRLSLNFPIQPAAGSPSPGISPSRSRPQSWVGAPSPLISPDIAPSPTEGNFLAVLAAQERRVLELKEELSKAEENLISLKKQWASHEAVKKRNDIRKVTQLQPLNTTLANHGVDPEDEDGSTLWLQREMERRKALLAGAKTSQRKVFSGSRHMRTLSLLSPDKMTYTPSFPQPLDVHDPKDEPAIKRPSNIRTTTSPDIANQIANTVDERYDLGGLPNIQREALLRTGKQMATDFKDGLLTFIEDIRQATVGEEAVGADGSIQPLVRGPSTKGNRKVSDGRPGLNRSASSRKASEKGADIGNDFWKEHGLSEPKASTATKKTPAAKSSKTPQKSIVAKKAADDFEESWDTWDTPPNDKYIAKSAPSSNSSDESDEPSSPVSGASTARTSTRYHSKRHDSKASTLTHTSSADGTATPRDQKRNSIPWPDMVKLSPSNLKRTASHLMKEWEKNLTPPPEARDANHASGDYIGRSVSPGDLA